jgi:hypothetical protein
MLIPSVSSAEVDASTRKEIPGSNTWQLPVDVSISRSEWREWIWNWGIFRSFEIWGELSREDLCRAIGCNTLKGKSEIEKAISYRFKSYISQTGSRYTLTNRLKPLKMFSKGAILMAKKRAERSAAGKSILK